MTQRGPAELPRSEVDGAKREGSSSCPPGWTSAEVYKDIEKVMLPSDVVEPSLVSTRRS